MSAPSPRLSDAPRALVVIPGKLNYFYNLNGRRVSETLQDLGVHVDLVTVDQLPEDRSYDICILSNISEVLAALGNEAAGMRRLKALRRRCQRMVTCCLDSVATLWYERLDFYCRQVGADAILDLALHDQQEGLKPRQQRLYRFLFNGLTTSECRQAEEVRRDSTPRPIPWAFVGHHTPFRTALVDFLVRDVDPRGFVYLPGLAPYPEKKSPHLNQEQFEAVLRKSRYHIWCSHHFYTYLEPERFRMSLLAGCVPVKMITATNDATDRLPFNSLLVTPEGVREIIRSASFPEIREQYFAAFLSSPTLLQVFHRYLHSIGLPTSPIPAMDRSGVNLERRQQAA